MRFSLATTALVGNALLFSVNGAPTGLSRREAQLDIPKFLAERAFIPPKIPSPKPEPVPGPSVPKPGPKPIEAVPPTIHPNLPATGGSSTRPAQDFDPAIPKVYEPKPVPEFGTTPGTFPYRSAPAREPEDPKWGQSYEIYSTSPKGLDAGTNPVNKIAVNKDTDTVSIFGALNKEDQPPIGQKLYLSDIMMSVFKQQGKSPTDLKAVHVDMIMNKDTDELFVAMYKGMGKNKETETVTLQSSSTGPEKDNFNKIAASPFGLAIDRANQQFSTGKAIQLFKISPNKFDEDSSDMDVVLA